MFTDLCCCDNRFFAKRVLLQSLLCHLAVALDKAPIEWVLTILGLGVWKIITDFALLAARCSRGPLLHQKDLIRATRTRLITFCYRWKLRWASDIIIFLAFGFGQSLLKHGKIEFTAKLWTATLGGELVDRKEHERGPESTIGRDIAISRL